MKQNKVSEKLEQQKAAIYIRVSTTYQIDKDSLPLQKQELINYAKYAINIEKYEVFEDAGYSAKNTDRPAYQQMLARLRDGEFTHILVWKIDRISRNLLDFAAMYAEMKQLGVTFISKNEQFDTSSAMGEAMLKIILVFAELERNMTSERVKAVMLSRATNGEWNGGKVAFGYDYDKESKQFTINEAEASIVKSIYVQYSQVHSLLAVSRSLNEGGVMTRKGQNWSPTTVSIILKNPFYIGLYRYNYHDESRGNSDNRFLKSESEWIMTENHHPAIIEAEQWNFVRTILTQNQRSNRNNKTYMRKNIHIFAGILQCGRCGSNMPSTIDRERADGYRPSLYQCSRHRRFSDCDNKYISDVTLGPFVLNYIANIMKAQNNFGKSTSIETFEKKLLRGELFSDVEGIESVGLSEMFGMLRSGKMSSDLYTSPAVDNAETNISYDEKDLLNSEKRKKERALARLKSLYLYSDDAISEKDFLVEQKLLVDAIEVIDSRLEEIEKNSSSNFSITDEEFISKASYFIMSQQLSEKRTVNFDTFIRNVDPQIIKEFINSIIQKIVILDGRVMQIRFKNGVEHKFLYKDQ
ncbi:MAG: recombinase family protein [Oscillospiraceae bacterium]